MTGSSLEYVMQQAIDFAGMTDVPVKEWTMLLPNNGDGYISQQSNRYLRLLGSKTYYGSRFHPLTRGRIERCHRTVKVEINQKRREIKGKT